MTIELPTPALDFCGLDTNCYAYFLYNWQSLIGGALTLVAAFYAGSWVHRQIISSDRIENDRAMRRERSARAVLPLTLTKFIDFSEACADIWRRAGRGRAAAEAGQWHGPAIPQQAISDLERAIEAANSAVAIELMTKLAGHTQVLHSIITDQVTELNKRDSARARLKPNLAAWEVRTARVYATASRLFGWARGEVDEAADVSWTHIEEALSVLNIGDHEAHRMITSAREKGIHPLAW